MIVKMDKIAITGLISQRNAVVRRLMKLGVVELADIPVKEEDISLVEQMAYRDDASARISEIDEELRKIKAAIAFLDGVQVKGKKAPKTVLTFDSFVDPDTYQGCWAKVFDANELSKRLTEELNHKNTLQNDLASLQPWENMDIPLEVSGTKTTKVYIGTLPAAADTEAFRKEVDDTGLAVSFGYSVDRDQVYLSVIAHESIRTQLDELFKKYGFSKASFEGRKGTIQQNIKDLKDQIAIAQQDIDLMEQEKVQAAESLPDIKKLYDYIANMQERRKVRKHFLYTDKAFMVGGWVPRELSKAVQEDLERDFDVYIEITQPAEDEQTPVLLQNNSFVYPHEMITEMYSLPKSTTFDPTPVMSVFYCAFFGLMVSDAGYGIVMALVTAFLIWKMKPEGTMDKMLKLLFFGGLSTTFWGALFGGWFGDFFQQAFGANLKPLWFNPLDDPMRLLVWSFVFGGIHLFVGMGMKAYSLIKEGKAMEAVMDIGSWYLLLLGLALLFAGGLFAEIGKYMAIAGAVALVLTQGRHEKNIILKIKSGVLSLYDVTGYLSDVLSYSRLLALGLATGVIATVVNTMGMLGGGFKTVSGAVIMVFAFIVGHIFNIAINALGAYVHSSRLQYVEFFGKFYEGGGKAFKPIKSKTKYVKITNKN